MLSSKFNFDSSSFNVTSTLHKTHDYCHLLFGLYPSSLCFATTTFLPSIELVSIYGPPIEASSIDRTQQSRFHLMTREESALETLWLQKIRTMDKVQIIDRSNTVPSSKTFRDENSWLLCWRLPVQKAVYHKIQVSLRSTFIWNNFRYAECLTKYKRKYFLIMQCFTRSFGTSFYKIKIIFVDMCFLIAREGIHLFAQNLSCLCLETKKRF
jgi:hypothetical protein